MFLSAAVVLGTDELRHPTRLLEDCGMLRNEVKVRTVSVQRRVGVPPR